MVDEHPIFFPQTHETLPFHSNTVAAQMTFFPLVQWPIEVPYRALPWMYSAILEVILKNVRRKVPSHRPHTHVGYLQIQ